MCCISLYINALVLLLSATGLCHFIILLLDLSHFLQIMDVFCYMVVDIMFCC